MSEYYNNWIADDDDNWEAPENLERLFAGKLQVGDVVMEADPVLRSCIKPGRVNLMMGKITGEWRLKGSVPVWFIEKPDGETGFIVKGSAVAMGCHGALAG